MSRIEFVRFIHKVASRYFEGIPTENARLKLVRIEMSDVEDAQKSVLLIRLAESLEGFFCDLDFYLWEELLEYCLGIQFL